MATIISKTKKGRKYYYAVESKRVNGKPRITWQKYLGTVEGIVKRTEDAKPATPKEAILSEFGGVAALLRITQRLGLLDLVNSAVPKRNQGPSVGHYMVLALINRAVDPCSKLAIGDWYEKTVLRRLWGFPKSAFSGQRFWDHMNMVSESAIESVEKALVQTIREHFDIDTRVLLYDTTNFFTFLATTNDEVPSAQRGKSKAKRHDLRLLGLALMTTRDFKIPLLHHVYPGNVPDVSLFPQIFEEMLERYREICGCDCEEATLVFDKGNVSDEILEKLLCNKVRFVAAVTAQRFPELFATPLSEFRQLPGIPGTRAFQAPITLLNLECQVTVSHSESFFTQQLAGVTHNMVKCQKKLLDLAKSLEKWHKGKGRGRRPTLRTVQASVKRILSSQFMTDLFEVSVENADGLPRMYHEVNHATLENLMATRLGRTALLTNQASWDASNVVQTYRSQASVEEAFKHMKNTTYLHWQPAYHWTEQKLRVHSFYCVLALMVTTLAHQEVTRHGIELSLPAMLKELCGIREVAVIYPTGTLARGKDHVTLSRMSPRQRKLAECLEISEAVTQK